MIEYLACPLQHEDQKVMHARYIASVKAMAHLMDCGRMVFNPLSHGYEVTFGGWLKEEWHRWMEFDLEIIKRACNKVTVLMIDGWEQSKGVGMEIDLAKQRNIDLAYLNPVECGLTFEFPHVAGLFEEKR